MQLKDALQRIAPDWHQVDDKTHITDHDGFNWQVEDGFGGVSLQCSGIDAAGKHDVVLKMAVSHYHYLPDLAARMRAAVQLLRGDLPEVIAKLVEKLLENAGLDLANTRTIIDRR